MHADESSSDIFISCCRTINFLYSLTAFYKPMCGYSTPRGTIAEVFMFLNFIISMLTWVCGGDKIAIVLR